jgi:hypothetical protein
MSRRRDHSGAPLLFRPAGWLCAGASLAVAVSALHHRNVAFGRGFSREGRGGDQARGIGGILRFGRAWLGQVGQGTAAAAVTAVQTAVSRTQAIEADLFECPVNARGETDRLIDARTSSQKFHKAAQHQSLAAQVERFKRSLWAVFPASEKRSSIWARDDATDDPEELRIAQRNLKKFKKAMNENRAATGERLLYPWAVHFPGAGACRFRIVQ